MKSLITAGTLLGGGARLAAWIFMPWPAVLGATMLLALWLRFSKVGRQALAITALGLASLPQRLGAASVIVIGIAGVVGVLVAMLAMGEGFKKTLSETGNDATAIILRGGSL